MKRHPPKGGRPTPDEFRARAREAFAFLTREFGFREEPVPRGFHNPVAVWYANATTRVVVEGIHWGFGSRVAVGRAGDPERFENFDLGDLVAVRSPGSEATDPSGDGAQLAQLPRLAAQLRELGADVLAGDFAVFPALRARVDRRAAEFRAGRDR
jgi:hypothetical protein